MYKNFLYILFLLLSINKIRAQESADAFLQRVSNVYSQIEDYQAQIRIQRGDSVESGLLRYRSPNLLRIDYQVPSGQILVVSENKVEFFLPSYGVVMEQIFPSDGELLSGIGLSGNGLKLLRENYFISYLNNGLVESLDANSNEKVVKLLLKWRVNAESFRTLEIAINANTLLIRRITGVTSLFETLQYDFTGITLNRGIPSNIFTYIAKEGQQTIRYPNFLSLQED